MKKKPRRSTRNSRAMEHMHDLHMPPAAEVEALIARIESMPREVVRTRLLKEHGIDPDHATKRIAARTSLSVRAETGDLTEKH